VAPFAANPDAVSRAGVRRVESVFYFNDCQGDEAEKVRRGRAHFLSQFRSLDTPAMRRLAYDPCDEKNFARSKLNFSQRETHAEIYALHRDLLTLRRADPVFCLHDAERLHGFALNRDALVLRYLGRDDDTRLLVVNFGGELALPSISHPLSAPPAGKRWQILWSSEDPAYRGSGVPQLDTDEGWRVPAEAAVVLQPTVKEDPS
jgi:maltooligosyltrehalose trehalohydrolase